MTEHKWKLTTHRPNPFRWEDEEMVYDEAIGPTDSPHRMGWITRKDALVPRGGLIAYQAKCKCRWKDTDDKGLPKWVPKRMIQIRYRLHILRVKEEDRRHKQGVLGDV